MTTQTFLPVLAELGAVLIGDCAALFENEAGGKVFINVQLAYVWGADQSGVRRLAASQLVETGVARVNEVAAGFGINTESLRRWRKSLEGAGLMGLAPVKKGPKRPSPLTQEKAAEIRTHRAGGVSLWATAAATGVSTDTVRRAMTMTTNAQAAPAHVAAEHGALMHPVQQELPVLPVPVARSAERAAARSGLLQAASPVFFPAARIHHAGLFLAFPALEATGLLACARTTYSAVPNGFYGLENILIDAALRALAGEARTEGAGRFDPVELGRVLGMDRAPEVKTIRREIGQLAEAGKAQELIAALAAHHLKAVGPGGENLAAILYVDGHVRAHQGTKKIGKLYSTRLKFPVPATEETWVSDAHGAPVFVVLAEPGASLAAELRDLLPELRTAIGDDRRVLVGFDRGGWSPALFKHMDAAGFDVLTWRKGTTDDIDPEKFASVSHTDEHGEERTWSVADTLVDLPLNTTKKTGEVFGIRQISRIVAATGGGTQQIHILTTDRGLAAGEVAHRMGNRWRQENQFRYARMHFELDSHDPYTSTSTDDIGDRLVPEPAKARAYQKVVAARARHAEAAAIADINLLALKTPAEGSNELTITVTSAMPNHVMAPVWEAENAVAAAQNVHQRIPAKVRLGDLVPGQQVLNTEIKLIHHGIRMAAYNTAMTIAREIRTNTGYKRASQEAQALMRQAFNQTGDFDPTEPGYLTITLAPLPTTAKTAAIAELCNHLTSTQTRYPGTDLILRYKIKNHIQQPTAITSL